MHGGPWAAEKNAEGVGTGGTIESSTPDVLTPGCPRGDAKWAVGYVARS